MAVISEEKLSDSPLVESVWHVQAQSDGVDIVVADTSWDMIITRQDGQTKLTVWGPMTKANNIPHVAGSEAIGIRFKLGTYLALIPTYSEPDSGLLLPDATSKAFWLNSSAWEYPTYENVDTFLQRLARNGLIGQDALVAAALQGQTDVSERSVQRRFLRITGLTQRYIRAIERAQQAAALLNKGTSILDAVYEAGYADQQHMTKSLRQLLGQTPAQIAGIRSCE